MNTKADKDLDEEPRPPRWAERFLQWYCAAHLQEEILGDLLEEFKYQARINGRRKARWDYVRSVLEFVSPFALRGRPANSPSLLNASMLKNYFITAIRNIARHPGYSLINLMGLTLVSSAACSSFNM